MILALRTDSNLTELKLMSDQGTLIKEMQWESGRELSDHLLDKIGELITEINKDWNDLEGLVVFQGPGSFTGLRIGATVANALAYVRNIPIVGTTGAQWVDDGVHRLNTGDNDKQVTPHYGAEPNITKPKK